MAKKKTTAYRCTCGQEFVNRNAWAAHVRWTRERGEKNHLLADDDNALPRPEVIVSTMASDNKPSIGVGSTTTSKQAAKEIIPTYLRVNITVPALLWVYYDAFRRHFDVSNSFSEWVTDCVLTLIESSEYELMLVRKGVDIEVEQGEQRRGMDEFLKTYELIVTGDNTFEEDRANGEGDAEDTWTEPD